MTGRAGAQGRYPVTPGHEFAGVVARTGRDVPRVTEGDLVCVDPNITCGRCQWCHKGALNHCANLDPLGISRHGSWAARARPDAAYPDAVALISDLGETQLGTRTAFRARGCAGQRSSCPEGQSGQRRRICATPADAPASVADACRELLPQLGGQPLDRHLGGQRRSHVLRLGPR